MNISVKDVAAMVDHTNLKAYATREDFVKLCDEARAYGFKSVAINTYPVKLCRQLLEGSEVLTGAAVGFPLGQMTIEAKVAEAEDAVKNGCQEFDYVCNVGKVKEHDWDYLEREMAALVAVARKAGICCKVIFETCYLTEEEIVELAKVAITANMLCPFSLAYRSIIHLGYVCVQPFHNISISFRIWKIVSEHAFENRFFSGMRKPQFARLDPMRAIIQTLTLTL